MPSARYDQAIRPRPVGRLLDIRQRRQPDELHRRPRRAGLVLRRHRRHLRRDLHRQRRLPLARRPRPRPGRRPATAAGRCPCPSPADATRRRASARRSPPPAPPAPSRTHPPGTHPRAPPATASASPWLSSPSWSSCVDLTRSPRSAGLTTPNRHRQGQLHRVSGHLRTSLPDRNVPRHTKGGIMSNERLRAAITAAGMTSQLLSERVGVDPKTVERWITTDRVPHRGHRMKTAAALGKTDGFLWPATESDKIIRSATQAEFVGLYPSRRSVPAETWSRAHPAGNRLDRPARLRRQLPPRQRRRVHRTPCRAREQRCPGASAVRRPRQ